MLNRTLFRKRIICIGNGLAALNLALNLSDDTELLVLGTSTVTGTNSYLAKGGIAIAVDPTDIRQHIHDTLIAGDGLCDPDVVEAIISSGPQLISQFEQLGIRFDESLSLEGGHSIPRIRHVSDETGKHLTTHLHEHVLNRKNVQLLTFYDVVDLSLHDNRCDGVYVVAKGTHTLEHIAADTVVLATGGCGNLFQHHTNSNFANGEGYAMAHKAGAQLRHMEFMQFHPTQFYSETSTENMLITEAFRGAGAIICDDKGMDIMNGIHPLGSLAPRDIVSRTMYTRMQSSALSCLWLDYSNVSPALLQQSFPAIANLCYRHQLYRTHTIPVSPAAHYMCGGVETDLSGQTSIPGLFAVGEVACTGLHGANRLASNSLLELFVVSKKMAHLLNDIEPSSNSNRTPKKMLVHSNKDNVENLMTHLQHIMWTHFGIVRNREKMQSGLYRLQCLHEQWQTLLPPHSSAFQRQMQNRVLTALLIAKAAYNRTTNKGCHFMDT